MGSKTALLSVFNKEGIVPFARALIALGYDLLSSGGTAKKLQEAGVPVRDIGEIVGTPIMGERVKTLSRQIHAGLLSRDTPEDVEELARIGMPRIDLVCVDLYPLEQAISKPDATLESVIEMTDIGGPTMLRSAAKGGRIVICDPSDRNDYVIWEHAGRPNEKDFVRQLAAKAEFTIAQYCLMSANYLGQGQYAGVVGSRVPWLAEGFKGENGPQSPAFLYNTGAADSDPLALRHFKLVAGAAPSYNNLCDLDRLLQTATHLAAGFESNGWGRQNIALGVKHGNCCGASAAPESGAGQVALMRMLEGDPRAIFVGVVMVNFIITAEIARLLLTHSMLGTQRRILDTVIAPGFDEEAIDRLQRKEGRCRLFVNPALSTLDAPSLDCERLFRPVRGGFLVQPNYTFVFRFGLEGVQEFGALTKEQAQELMLAWGVGCTSNSNTITLVRNSMLIGNGVGQQDRVSAAELAIKRAKDAGHNTRGAVAYSDSFFPFDDGPKKLINEGVSAILTTSGSIRDKDTIRACQDAGVTLVMIPDSVGRGFFRH